VFKDKPSVIVVGAGIVGCTVAHALAKSGARVQVLEPRSPGQGATRASAGILAPDIEGHGSQLLRTLGRRSIAMYDDFIADLRADSLPTGALAKVGAYVCAPMTTMRTITNRLVIRSVLLFDVTVVP